MAEVKFIKFYGETSNYLATLLGRKYGHDVYTH